MLERISLGALSESQGRSQYAYAARFARQYSNIHSYQRRQNARGQRPRHPDTSSFYIMDRGFTDFSRWFTLQIKQHLGIKGFYGTSENAVKTQIWIAISVTYSDTLQNL